VWVKSAAGRNRFNALGAVNATTKKMLCSYTEGSVNAETVCSILVDIYNAHPEGAISVVLDNAPYSARENSEGNRNADRSGACLLAALFAKPQPHRASMETRQEKGSIQSPLRNLRELQDRNQAMHRRHEFDDEGGDGIPSDAELSNVQFMTAFGITLIAVFMVINIVRFALLVRLEENFLYSHF